MVFTMAASSAAAPLTNAACATYRYFVHALASVLESAAAVVPAAGDAGAQSSCWPEVAYAASYWMMDLSHGREGAVVTPGRALWLEL